MVKNLPAMQETWVQSLGWEDPLEKEKATHSRILAWRIPWTIQPMRSQSRTRLSDFHFHFFFPVFLLGEVHGQRGPWGHRVGHNWATSTLTQCIQFSLNKSSVLTLLKCVWSAPVHILGRESSRRYKVSLCHIQYQPIFNKKLISLCLEHKLWRQGSFSTGFATVL